MLTAKRFVVNPFTKAPDDRVYRTGDLGRYRPDGTVEFDGRRDGQVKIRGFRVELGDVEAALRRCPGVGAAVVLLRHEAGRDAQLVAYVVGTGGESPVPERAASLTSGTSCPATWCRRSSSRWSDCRSRPTARSISRRCRSRRRGRRANGSRPGRPRRWRWPTIWGDVLAIEAVDVEDNFFELGGHSLLAVTLFSRIEKVFGLTLPLATLFQAPTLERQAELIDQRGLDAPWRALVPIQPAGSRPPLFAIPGLGGIVVAFNDLATLLGPDQPFYALQPRGLDGKLPPFESIEETAEHYLTEVRALQPQGPYFLMGVCMGGLVAFEMAQRLRAAGQEVAFLALLDVRPPHPMLRWMPAVRPAALRGCRGPDGQSACVGCPKPAAAPLPAAGARAHRQDQAGLRERVGRGPAAWSSGRGLPPDRDRRELSGDGSVQRTTLPGLARARPRRRSTVQEGERPTHGLA